LNESTTDNAYDPLPTKRSRQLRNNATPAERKLWNVLKNRQLCGVRFNRQVVIWPYICDLVARSAKLVIELDGGQHGLTIAYDDARTVFLEAKGYRVLRFWNNDVLENLEGVVRTIERALKNTPPARAGGEEVRSTDGEGLSFSKATCPPPLASGESTPPAPAGGARRP
jgi:very-short-patch-repair endonuclease